MLRFQVASATKTAKKKKSNWGGAREGAGRKPNGDKAGNSRLKRPVHKGKHPVHTWLEVQDDVPNLKTKKRIKAVQEATEAAARPGFRVKQFAVHRNELHFIIDAEDQVALSRGMQGLSIRIARVLNLTMEREGRFFSDRYASEFLDSPAKLRKARKEFFG